jgi:broad specificity phosphatase PhoE
MKHKGRIGLVRHGETYANINKVWHGYTDTELTEQGQRQAKQLGNHFHKYMQPDVIIASPLQRARITAESIAKQFSLDVTLDPRLKEFNLGDWEGRSFTSLQEDGDIIERLISDPHFTAPNGESQTLVKQRIVSAIEETLERHSHQNILFVAHGITLSIAISHFLDNDTRLWPQYSKNNTAFSELCLNTKQLLSFNKTDHLD